MSDGEKQAEGGKQARSAKDAMARVKSQLTDAKRKSFEADLKKKVEELQGAENVFLRKEQEVADFIEEHEYLYKA